MRLDLKATKLLEPTLRGIRSDDYRYVLSEGGTRSSKTYSILQSLILTALDREVEIDVCRRHLKVLRSTAMEDFEEILREYELYQEGKHDKTNSIYQIGGGRVRFFGADQGQKLRGAKRDLLYVNEANEISQNAFRELRRRTRDTILLDLNPSHGKSHWIDEQVLGSGRTLRIKSTYQHNPFLTEAQIEDIEDDVPIYEESDGTRIVDWDLEYDGDGVLVSGDPVQWSVHGLGRRATSPHLVYPHWRKRRRSEGLDPIAYGLDFGNAVPSALVAIYVEETKEEDDDRMYWHELIYEAGLTTPQIIARMDGVVDKDTPIYADHEQDRIDQISDAGYLIGQANKSVSEGIDTVKQHQLCITPSSKNIEDEITSYKRKVVDGEVTESVIKDHDHSMDGGRYGIHTHTTDPITPRRVSAASY
jgi:phage terminase large subunit